MIRNYIKIGFRNFVKNKGYSAINIAGLAVGMAVAMLIGLWVYDELSFNSYHKNYERIGRVMENDVVNGIIETSATVPFPFVNELKSNYGDNFQYIIASTHTKENILTAGEKKLTRKGQFMEADAPEMLSLKMLKGSRQGLLSRQSLLISASTSLALFGEADPMGKTVRIDTDKTVTVTGVYQDLPQNTEFHEVQFLASWDYFLATNRYMSQKQWDNHALWIYVQLKPETTFKKASADILDSQLKAIRDIDNMKHLVNMNPQMWVLPMADWHLYANFENGKVVNGPVQYVWMVSLIGSFVLLLACINFINLSTARSEKRGREVGVRKAIGSLRSQLIGQFMVESFMVVLIAYGLALVLVSLFLPAFNDLAAKQMSLPILEPGFWILNLTFILITGLLAGAYPAFYLTSFQPVKMLKTGSGSVERGHFSFMPRKVLVVLQFAISVTLITGTIIIYQQIRFAKNRPVGYSRESLLMIEMKSEDFYGKTDVLRTALKNTGMVSEIAESLSPVTGVWSANSGITWKGNTSGKDNFATLTVSPEYAETVGWKFISGRNFSKDLATDSLGFVINKTAAKLLGFSNPVGETISWRSQWMTNDVLKHFTILGVVDDMVMQSPFDPVAPTVFFLFGSPNWLNIRINPNISASVALPRIESVFKKLIPSAPFDYKFADQEYAAKFRVEERISKLTGVFSVLAILISCLGLFGLASFVAEQRTKEIGIRKVLGASVAGIWKMLSKDFIILVVVACLVSVPIAWYSMNIWLEKYKYHIDISWWIFAITSAGALLITLLTVSYQAIRAGFMDPVKSLRSE
jgi:predicted permease